MARRIAELDWHTALGHVGKLRQLPDRPLFDVVASLDGRRTFNRYDLENATGAALAPILRGRHLARTGTARPDGDSDLTVRLFVHGPDAAVALRLADRPLHRRPWKLDTGPGTLAGMSVTATSGTILPHPLGARTCAAAVSGLA